MNLDSFRSAWHDYYTCRAQLEGPPLPSALIRRRAPVAPRPPSIAEVLRRWWFFVRYWGDWIE